MQEGDRVVLKRGRSTIQAVGEVVKYNESIYNYSDCFSDVDGWDLQHFLKVKWKDICIQLENSTALHRSTMSRLHKVEVISRIEKEWGDHEFIRDKHVIPRETSTKEIDYHELEEELINLGLRIQDAENTSRTIEQVEKLANWYLNHKLSGTEHEIRTFLVIPFLQALGWSPQKIGIEVSVNRSKLDIVLFRDNNREHPKIIVETKKMGDGSRAAIRQMKNYLSNNTELLNIRNFIVTDGLRYWLYYRTDNNEWKPSAYMNFKNKMKKYSAYPNVDGMFGFIKKLIC